MKLIIADDHSVVRDGLRWMLSDREDIQIVAEAGDGSTSFFSMSECRAYPAWMPYPRSGRAIRRRR
jgi:DNA-binding NarL/FixJ family response regulator